MLQITPTLYRDYNGKKGVIEAFEADMDFRVNARIGEFKKFDGYACNKSDLIDMGVKQVKIRYKNLTEFIIVDVS